MGRYESMIWQGVDSKWLSILPGVNIIWGHCVRSEMVPWHLKSRPQVKLTINRGQFVASEMTLWHSKVISASVNLVLKIGQLDKFKRLYILVKGIHTPSSQ